MLIQSGLHKSLKMKPRSCTSEGAKGSNKDSNKYSVSEEDWKYIDLRAASVIHLYLAKNVLANVHGILMANGAL